MFAPEKLAVLVAEAAGTDEEGEAGALVLDAVWLGESWLVLDTEAAAAIVPDPEPEVALVPDPEPEVALVPDPEPEAPWEIELGMDVALEEEPLAVTEEAWLFDCELLTLAAPERDLELELEMGLEALAELEVVALEVHTNRRIRLLVKSAASRPTPVALTKSRPEGFTKLELLAEEGTAQIVKALWPMTRLAAWPFTALSALVQTITLCWLD